MGESENQIKLKHAGRLMRTHCDVLVNVTDRKTINKWEVETMQSSTVPQMLVCCGAV